MGSSTSILGDGQRKLVHWVLGGTALMLANSAYLALAGHVAGVGDDPHVLPGSYQVALVFHLVIGIATFVPAMVFTIWHMSTRPERAARGSTTLGILVLGLALFLTLSGFFILSAANSRENRWAFIGHQVAAVLLPLIYLAHRLASRNRPTPRTVWRSLAGMTVVLAAFWLAHGIERRGAQEPATPGAETAGHLVRLPTIVDEAGVSAWQAALPWPDPFVPFRAVGDIPPTSPFGPGATTTATGGLVSPRILHHDDEVDHAKLAKEVKERGFSSEQLIGAASCERCHADTVAQWKDSAHRFASFNNPFYKASVEALRKDHGFKKSQFCASCHDPAILFPGNMMKEINAETMEAQAGLTCLFCHSIDRIHNRTGNGAYRLQDEQPPSYAFEYARGDTRQEIHDYVMKAKPAVHKREMLKPFFRTGEYCSICHKVNLDVPVNGYRWLRGQNEYDNWHNTGVSHNNPQTWYEPPVAKTCQDCHMPPEDAPLGDVAARGGKIRSHRFLAVNSALPHIRGDTESIKRMEAFLRDAKLRVDVFALHREDGRIETMLDKNPPSVRPGEVIQIDVVVRNQGVGHTFPGGTNDSNEGWVDFSLNDGRRALWQSGAIDARGHVDSAAHFYGALLVDKESRRIARRNVADIHTTVYASVIPPSGSDIARYRFRIPETQPEGELTVRAALSWRKFNRTYVEFVFEGRPIPDLPVTVIAENSIRLHVAREARAASPAALQPADWMRMNDYGIGLFLDGDTRGALTAFSAVAKADPKRVDGWRNQARVLISEGALSEAEALLRKASEVAPEDARSAFFWGQLLLESGRLAEAESALRRTLERYPDSRDTWSLLGRTLWENGDAEGSLKAFLEVLRIDPEDALAHHQRSLAYKRLAAGEKNAERRDALARAGDEAARAFEKYKLDEDAAAFTLKFRLDHPDDNAMSQRIIIHAQEQL